MNKKLQQRLEDFIQNLKDAVETIQQECNAKEAMIEKLESDYEAMNKILQSQSNRITDLESQLQEVLKNV